MLKIVTVEREYGCGGGEIAQRLAAQLGWKLWDHLLTEEIARLANCSKAVVEQREERTGIGKRIKPIRARAFAPMGMPRLEQGAGRRKQQER